MPYEQATTGTRELFGAGKGLSRNMSAKWSKVLWKRQPFPDNYTDHTFLQQLVVNAAVPPRSYWPVALASAAVTQQLACALVAAVVPLLLHSGVLRAGQLLAACGGLLAAG
ncbi:hypothetical protein Agub_g12280, partial [Astrephomene gubernaculifera]